MHQLEDKALSLSQAVQSVNNLIVCKDGIIKFYNGGGNKRDEKGRFTCVNTFKNCEKSRFVLVNIELFFVYKL